MTINRLNVFIGSWRTDGEIFPQNGAGPSKLVATDSYEWFPGAHFILHHVDGQMGENPVKALEIMRYDQESDRFLSTSIDNGGQHSEYELNLNGRNWSIIGETERFWGEFNSDFTILEGRWLQISDDKVENPWMKIRLTKEQT